MLHRLERSQFIPAPPVEVFRFFEDAGNLEELTPAFLHFRILTPRPIRMAPGVLIDYRIRISGLPVRWTTLIERYEPPGLFTDVQVRGPYRRWHHLHEFHAEGAGTRMRDVVDYELPQVPCRGILHRAWVAPRLETIFDFRRDLIAARFGPG